MGALAGGGEVVLNDDVVADLGVDADTLAGVIAAESAELDRRERVYRGGRPAADVAGRTVLLIDDGLATGASMLAAVRAVRAGEPAAVVVGVPVAPASACRALAREADRVVCVDVPARFDAVGQAYRDFHQVGDDEVRRLLAERPAAGA